MLSFVCGSDKYRNTHVKIIPAVVDGGNWLVRNAVGNRPAILGNKLTQTYHTDEKKNYLEVRRHVGGGMLLRPHVLWRGEPDCYCCCLCISTCFMLWSC